jgi:hypothetical protein
MADVKKRSIETSENVNDDWLGPKQSEAEVDENYSKPAVNDGIRDQKQLAKKRKSKTLLKKIKLFESKRHLQRSPFLR